MLLSFIMVILGFQEIDPYQRLKESVSFETVKTIMFGFLVFRVNLEFPDCLDTQEDKDQR